MSIRTHPKGCCQQKLIDSTTSSPITNLDQLVEKFITDPQFRTDKFSNNLIKLKEYANLLGYNQLGFPTMLSYMFTNTDNDLHYNIKMFINSENYDYAYQIMKICFDTSSNKFSDIITPDFITLSATTVYHSGLYYREEFISYFLGSSYDRVKEAMLIELFTLADLNPNMIASKHWPKVLLVEAGRCQYYGFMKLLLDKGANVFRGDYPMYIGNNHSDYWSGLFYYADVYRFIYSYFSEKGDDKNINKIKNYTYFIVTERPIQNKSFDSIVREKIFPVVV